MLKVSTTAGPRAARAWSRRCRPSAGSPQWTPRRATIDVPRSASGTVGNGGKDRKVTAAVSSSGSVRLQSAKNSSTSRLRVNG